MPFCFSPPALYDPSEISKEEHFDKLEEVHTFARAPRSHSHQSDQCARLIHTRSFAMCGAVAAQVGGAAVAQARRAGQLHGGRHDAGTRPPPSRAHAGHSMRRVASISLRLLQGSEVAAAAAAAAAALSASAARPRSAFCRGSNLSLPWPCGLLCSSLLRRLSARGVQRANGARTPRTTPLQSVWRPADRCIRSEHAAVASLRCFPWPWAGTRVVLSGTWS